MGASECSFNVAYGENEIDASRVKDGDRVICTGTWDKNGVLQATVISKLCTGICQRTRSISEAGDDLDYLSKKDESSHGAGIEGTIEQLTRDSPYETRVIEFMAGISVLVQGPSGRWTTVSQKDGRFRLWGLQLGRYRITAVLPKSFLPSTETVTLEPYSCVAIRFLATPPEIEMRTARK